MAMARQGSVLLYKTLMGRCTGTVRTLEVGTRGFTISAAREAERFFTKKHEWVLVDGNKGTVGVSKHAAGALGEIVYAQLPEPGDTVTAGEECGALESVKAAGEVYSPVSGEVTEKNVAVEEGPMLINESPEEEGWLFRLNLSAAEEVQHLMNTEAYETFLSESEDH